MFFFYFSSCRIHREGFKKVKGGASRSESSDSWEEFMHPQFRQGRRDLLVSIKRQKDGGHLKRKQGVTTHSSVGVAVTFRQLWLFTRKDYCMHACIF